MPTINVVDDHGAVGDGTNDDTVAIRSALDAATDGDDVYFPGPATYLVDVDNTTDQADPKNIFTLDRDGTVSTKGNVANLEIRGDGSGTIIKNSPTSTSIHKMFQIYSRGGWTDLHFHDIELDGDRATVTTDGQGINFPSGGSDTLTTPTGARFVNVRVFDWSRSNIKHNTGGGTVFERVTAENAGTFHGIATGGENGAGEITVKHCKLIDNGGYGLDLSGTATVEDTVMARNGTGGTKITPELRASGFATYRRCRAINNPSGGFTRISPSNVAGHDVTYEDCISEGNDGFGFRLAGSDVVTIGHVLNKGNNVGDLRNNTFLVTDGAQISSATLIESEDSLNTARGSSNGSTATHSIDTYRHFNNAGGGGDFDGAGYVGTTENTDPSGDISSVPVESDVGAFSATGSSATALSVPSLGTSVDSAGTSMSGTVPATISVIDDFEDTNPLSEWTHEIGTDWTTTATAFEGSTAASSAAGGNAGGIASVPGDGLNDYFAAGETSKVYAQWPNATESQLYVWWGLSVTGDLLSDGYYMRYHDGPDEFRLYEESGNTDTQLGSSIAMGLQTATWYELEIQWDTGAPGDITVTITEDPDGTPVEKGTIGPVTPSIDYTGNEGVGLYKDATSNPVYVDYWHIP